MGDDKVAIDGLKPEMLQLEDQEQSPGEFIHCRFCAAPITSTREKIEIGISHHHRFTNPAGIIYSIGCFCNAPGCTLNGYPSKEFSWFGGYQWQVVSCSECLEHLGWYYENKRQRFFFGLIISKLVEKLS